MNKIILLAAIASLGACAKQPDQIAAVDIGSNEYRGYSCKQLLETEVKYTQALTNLSAQQKSAANGDAWGVFLLGLPLSSMGGNDKETMIAVTKGHLQSIDREQARKNCS
ncbi:hypothetical protein [Sulfitobacter sp. 20_GPM-1509m]|uniref:hypothetical protein n=1 Tax=Sulfitobacter sp. 20_GPM-1509m TaxID=1380367 RepID=UPI0009DEF75B|nr:hypothetical protein [Sulfitobacter sp. 20_GPM-1509m]